MDFILAMVTFLLVCTVRNSRVSSYAVRDSSSCEELASQGSCAFYPQCLEKRAPCGNDGYAMGFGHKYCVKFSDALSNFDADGQTFVTKTRSCLTTAMIQSDVYKDSSFCADIDRFGFASHPQCYFDAGFCTAIVPNLRNLNALRTVISTQDFFRSEIRSAMWDTLQLCTGKYYNSTVREIWYWLDFE